MRNIVLIVCGVAAIAASVMIIVEAYNAFVSNSLTLDHYIGIVIVSAFLGGIAARNNTNG